MKIGLLAILAGLGAAPPVKNPWSAPPPPWEGTWQGTIGKLPIHMCLNNTPYMNQGAYYYDAHKKLIRLDRSDDAKEWLEKGVDDKVGARLRLAVDKDKLAGSWSDGRKMLPVQLHRIGGASQEFEGPCSSTAFQRPRVGPIRIVGASKTKDGARITNKTFKAGLPFSDVEISTFSLDRPSSAVARVNSILRAILPNADGSGAWLDCMASNANAHGVDGDYSEEIEPILITERWLGVRHSGGYYCGGAHPENYSRLRTFDLSTGEEIDLDDWFTPSAVHVERYSSNDVSKTLTAEFVKVILDGWTADDDCPSILGEQQYWEIGIDRGALVFSPNLPRVMMACGEDFEVPFAKLQPWLNAKGKAAIATLPR